MNILLMLHVSSAVLCLLLTPVLFLQAFRQSNSGVVTASVVSILGVITTGGILLVQSSLAGLPLFCIQTSSLFLVMYGSYNLGQRMYRKKTSTV